MKEQALYVKGTRAKKKKREFSKTLDVCILIMAIVCTFIHAGLTLFAGFREYSDIELSSFGNVVLAIWGGYTTVHSFYLHKSKCENLNKYENENEGRNHRGI